MNKTNIEYLTHTLNPFAMRCDPVGAGCEKCWHLRMADRLGNNPKIPPNIRNAYLGECDPILDYKRLLTLKRKKPAVIGVQFMGDLFHPGVKPDDIKFVFDMMAYHKQHIYVLLTKRPERMKEVLYGQTGSFYLGEGDYYCHIWLGVSVENKKSLTRAQNLLNWDFIGWHKWISFEPLIEVIPADYIDQVIDGKTNVVVKGSNPRYEMPLYEYPDWVVVGGETGGSQARVVSGAGYEQILTYSNRHKIKYYFKQPASGQSRSSIYPPALNRKLPEDIKQIKDEHVKHQKS